MNHQHVAVSYQDASQQKTAELLAEELSLDLILPADPVQTKYSLLLIVTPNFLGLQKPNDAKPFYIDFLAGKLHYRQQQASLRKELLARAIGESPGRHPIIVDATAGLGRDSFILATIGFEVTLIERSPIVYALLRDAMNRARQNSTTAPIMQRMHLIHTDASQWLSGNKMDVIYLDPMFPTRQKSALVKKEMVLLQELLGTDTDSNELLSLALTCATKRVVVKRPRLAAYLSELAPNFSLTGKSSRFDVYLRLTQG